MLDKLLGKKVGMTQVFDDNKSVVPATVVRIPRWYVTQIKTVENDGYAALQLATPRQRFASSEFVPTWLQDKKTHFLHVCEVPLSSENTATYQIGQALTVQDFGFERNNIVAVSGVSRGLGFQGVMKRWGFHGGPKSHGSKFHRRPGSSGHLRRQGEVIKGKRFPGHCGFKRVTVRGLTVVRVDADNGCVLVKGAVPGKLDTLLEICRQG